MQGVNNKFDENFKIKEHAKIVKLLKPLITSLRQGKLFMELRWNSYFLLNQRKKLVEAKSVPLL